MMRKRLAVLASIALMAGCGTPVPDGEVVDRYYSAAYTWFLYNQSCSGTGATFRCTQTITPIFEPERFVITLENCDLKEPDEDECPTQRHNVGEGTYNNLQIGMTYDTETGDIYAPPDPAN